MISSLFEDGNNYPAYLCRMIFLLDNYDSFTYNLYDYLAQLGSEVVVERNDCISVGEIEHLYPEAIVISPGPGTPDTSGITLQLIHHFHRQIPILGICLGYQAIGQYFGADVVKSPLPMHGKTSSVKLQPDPVFEGISSPAEVMRYHSLNIDHIPDALSVIASTRSGEPMALRHCQFPVVGFQFHPESILTPSGFAMLRNWHRSNKG